MIRDFKEIIDGLRAAGLVLRIFFAVTRPRLYFRVVFNHLKNAAGFRSPASAVLGLTYRCQLNCGHCSAGLYEKSGRSELTTGELKSLLLEIKDLGVPRVNLSGGEALLRKDIFEIIDFASRYFVTVLESNGVAEDENVVRRLKAEGLACLAVSLDSPEPAEHDLLRGKEGLFVKALETLKTANRLGLPALISTYMTNERLSAENLEKLEKLRRETGALAVRIMPARPVGNFSCCEPLLLSPENEKFLLGNINRCFFYFKGLPGPEKCGIFLKNTFYVSPYGEVQPCAYLPLSFGKAGEKPLGGILEKMWDSPVFREAGTENCLIIDKAFREKHLSGAGKLPKKIED